MANNSPTKHPPTSPNKDSAARKRLMRDLIRLREAPEGWTSFKIFITASAFKPKLRKTFATDQK